MQGGKGEKDSHLIIPLVKNVETELQLASRPYFVSVFLGFFVDLLVVGMSLGNRHRVFVYYAVP